MLMTPQLSYFVAEDLLASAMMLGARGSYSSQVCTNPAFMLTLFGHAAHGNGKCLATIAVAHVAATSRNFLGLEDQFTVTP